MSVNQDFYWKLSEKQPISILVAGDSIAYGSSSSSPDAAFAPLFAKGLQRTFGCPVSLTNISVGGTDSLFSYVVVNRQKFAGQFDLVVLCHGQNDAPEAFFRNYESLLLAVLKQNPGCEIVCMLESAQREYSEKIKTILHVAAHYGCAVCDTLAAFQNSGKPYETLVSEDGVHPNDIGHRLYAYELLRTVERGLSSRKFPAGSRALPEPLSMPLTAFRYFPRNCLKREELSLSVTVAGEVLCLHVLEGPAGGSYQVTEKGSVLEERSLKHEFGWIWERMYPLPGEKNKRKTLKFILQNANDLDRIIGVSVMC